MDNNWTRDELASCVATYLWMLRAIGDGFTPVKSRVNAALREGPLHARSSGSAEYRFQNISAVLDQHGEPWIEGYKPASNVGSVMASTIWSLVEACRNQRSRQRLGWLVAHLPTASVVDAANRLAAGAEFEFPDSTTYDVHVSGKLLPPKKVIAYACQLFYEAPLYPSNLSAGDGHPAFMKLSESRLVPQPKLMTEPESEQFRSAVKVKRGRGFAHKPTGNHQPAVHTQTSVVYIRDPAVVAFVENRAKGKCELCGADAPFFRPDESPYLEVHHIKPLSEGGPDVVENAAALCPNCHRACHHSSEAQSHRSALVTIIASISVDLAEA